MLADRRVKIVATMGPSTRGRERLAQAVAAGMNIARINFSHGSHEDHLSTIKDIRDVAKTFRAPVGILQDLQGPKIRVGKFQGGAIELTEGKRVVISPRFEVGTNEHIPTDFAELPSTVKPGAKVLLDDGLLELKVLAVRGDQVECEVVYGGILKDRKGINLPGTPLPIDCLTPKDMDDLEFGLDHNVDYVALSFVRSAKDILKLRELVEAKRPGTRVIAKIEMLEAIEHLEKIIEASDGVMVARGDLAVEVGQSVLPNIQKRIIQMANRMKKPVITATQMLDSMVENPRPTRAEITDVANAVLDGSDALMLSAETASGRFPFKCIQTMHEIISEVERTSDLYYNISFDQSFQDVAEGIAASACLTALKLNAAAIVCLTTTGRTATLISSFRPRTRIIAATYIPETLNRLELAWGINSFGIQAYRSSDEAIMLIEDLLLNSGLVKKGDQVVFTMGTPVGERAKTNTLKVHKISKEAPKKLTGDLLPLRLR